MKAPDFIQLEVTQSFMADLIGGESGESVFLDLYTNLDVNQTYNGGSVVFTFNFQGTI